MPNPILEQIARTQSGNLPQQQNQPYQSNQFAYVKNLYKMVKNSNNPAMLQNIISQNPQMQQVVNLAQSKNLNYQQIFRELARQKGIDPDKFIQELQN